VIFKIPKQKIFLSEITEEHLRVEQHKQQCVSSTRKIYIIAEMGVYTKTFKNVSFCGYIYVWTKTFKKFKISYLYQVKTTCEWINDDRVVSEN